MITPWWYHAGMKLFIAVVVSFCCVAQAHAWNALGHRVVADIAWQQLEPKQRHEIVATLRRHPRFDDDFAKKMPADVDEDRWIFQQAAVWPDIARGLQGDDRATYDHPTWHYVNFPLFIGGERPLLDVNLSSECPTQLDDSKWNVAQAVKHAISALESDAPPSDKALAYCWLLHLVGDLHQPMHSTAIFSQRFPSGDRGGNLIPVVQGGNLHSLWDGLLGRADKPNDVRRVVAELEGNQSIWEVDVGKDVAEWIAESHELAKTFAYSPEVISAVEEEGELQRINLPETYLQEAGRQARPRVVAAGLRVGGLLRTPLAHPDEP